MDNKHTPERRPDTLSPSVAVIPDRAAAEYASVLDKCRLDLFRASCQLWAAALHPVDGHESGHAGAGEAVTAEQAKSRVKR